MMMVDGIVLGEDTVSSFRFEMILCVETEMMGDVEFRVGLQQRG
jgi:hypothetical protein